MSGLFDHLKAAALANWTAYTSHDFVQRLAGNRLPEAAFRFYLVQDYLFLIQFARAQALAAYKSRTLREMRAAKDGLVAILDVELDLHVRLSARWGLSPDDLESASEHAATVAYTRLVLDAGMAGDLLDLRVALAPCVIGYGEIARAIAPEAGRHPGHPQGDWVAEYAGEAYQDVARAAREELDRLGHDLPPRRLAELERLFAKACDLEAAFWQMALDESARQPFDR
ncbi:TenA family protein [Aureimonas psammosilenae]|uniref:TenA family protein n=1 Tax=Aureimonas psammosilenae TaxID=2495496 RepID=UPI001260B888|nr:TenA family protein [Aureimonas psammosilenae]